MAATVMMGGFLEALFIARANQLSDKSPLFRAKAAPRDQRTTDLAPPFNHAGRAQLCHAIPEPGGHQRTREDTTSLGEGVDN